MNFKWNKKGKCLIDLEKGEQILVKSKNDSMFFLQITVDEFDDLLFTKRENLKGEINEL